MSKPFHVLRCRLPAGVFILAVAAQSVAGETPDLSDLFHWRSPFWNLPPAEALAALGASVSTAGARRSAHPVGRGLQFNTLALPDPVLHVERGRPVRLESALYRHERQGRVPLGWLLKQFAAATNAVSRWAASEPLAMTRPGGAHAWVWGRPPHIVSIEWHPGEPEQPTAATRELRLVAEPWPPRRHLPDGIVRTPEDDRLLPVPMVDQRQQGLCAPATVERVLRYYGIPLGASALAQLAESTPETGTNVQRMLDELVRLRGLRCDIHEAFGFDLPRFERLLAAYNRKALEGGAPPLSYKPPALDLAQVFSAADSTLLRPIAAAQPGRRTFRREIRRAIDHGHPLLWGVVLGIVPENGLAVQARGGHLRLIVGYNPSTSEVLFSDSWGAAHVLKRIPEEDAWAMTMTLHVIAPPRWGGFSIF